MIDLNQMPPLKWIPNPPEGAIFSLFFFLVIADDINDLTVSKNIVVAFLNVGGRPEQCLSMSQFDVALL